MIALLSACAQVRSLPGGDKDSTPPVVLMAFPPNLSTQFNSKSITLVFNEYVQLNNINQELLVSPPLPHNPKVKVKKRTVIISLQDELMPNTTYMFNFGDGIIDVNENNKAKDLLYVFSTGDVIDSLSIRGQVRDVFADAVAKNFKVLLFENDTDIFAKKSLPLYFTKTKEDGSFVIPHLREGNFFMYALDDLNSNYKWDEGEAIGKQIETVTPSSNDSLLYQIQTSVPIPAKPILDYKTDSVGRFQFALIPEYHNVEIKSLNGIDVMRTTDGDTIITWLKGAPTNRLEPFSMMRNEAISDTIEVPFFDEAQKKNFPLSISSNKKVKAGSVVAINAKVFMTLNENISISATQDSLPVTAGISPAQAGNTFNLEMNLSPGKQYHIEIFPGTFSNAAGGTNDTLRADFITYKKEELGLLQFNVSGLTDGSHYFFSLSDKMNEVVFKKSNLENGIFQIPDLPAGEYSAKILEDDNQNERFDPMNIKSSKPSEVMHNFPGKVAVRSNWEVKLDWEVK